MTDADDARERARDAARRRQQQPAGEGPPPVPPRRDPTKPVTQAEVEQDIMAVSQAMEYWTHRLVDRALDHANTQHTYGLAKAKAVLANRARPGDAKGGGTVVAVAEAQAKVETEQQWLADLIAEAHYETVREILRTLRTQMEGLRTIAANVRAQT